MELEVVYAIPDFVKEASAAQIDPSQPGALVVGGYRFDNPAAVWTTGATIKKLAMDDPAFNPGYHVMHMLKQASELFGITEESFILNPANVDTVLVKTASNEAELYIADQIDFEGAVHAVLRKRSSSPYTFCKECAKQLLNIQADKGYVLDNNLQARIEKVAGEGHVDFERGVQEIQKRAGYAKRIGNTKAAALLNKFASEVTNSTSSAIIPYVIEGLDEFDRGVNILNKVASQGMTYPEDAFYMTAGEYLNKQANEEVELDNDLKVTQRSLIKAANNPDVCSWVNKCGYKMGANGDVLELRTALASMPKSLKKEFVETFA